MGRDLDREDLVGQAIAGDLDAFTELGRRWIDRLYAVACLILRDGEMAADATQEALIAAGRKAGPHKLSPPPSFGGFSLRVARSGGFFLTAGRPQPCLL